MRVNGWPQDWEDNVDTKVYMKLLTGLRKAFDAAKPSKKYLITVAPGWPRYPWDSSANGVVDAFDMMSYSNSLQDLTSKIMEITRRAHATQSSNGCEMPGLKSLTLLATVQVESSFSLKPTTYPRRRCLVQ